MDKNKPTNRSKSITEKLKEPFRKCRICDAPAKYSYFGVIACSSCKMFFKRNAETKKRQFRCDFDDHCEININTRHVCSACRLAKCFNIGMQTELIRCSTSKKSLSKDSKQKFSILNLLKLNHSILSTDQWNLLSNIIQYYDEQNDILLAERFLSEQKTLPFKLRFKYGSVYEFISSIINKAQLIFNRNSSFISLCSHDRSILRRYQMKYVSIIILSFILYKTHLIEYSSFYKTLKTIFGETVISLITRAYSLVNFDILFFKLILSIISFSVYDYGIYEDIINIKTIRQTQNTYMELTWRYLTYEYNNQQTIIHFSKLINYILTINNTLILMQDEKLFAEIVDSTIQQTEHIVIDNI